MLNNIFYTLLFYKTFGSSASLVLRGKTVRELSLTVRGQLSSSKHYPLTSNRLTSHPPKK